MDGGIRILGIAISNLILPKWYGQTKMLVRYLISWFSFFQPTTHNMYMKLFLTHSNTLHVSHNNFTPTKNQPPPWKYTSACSYFSVNCWKLQSNVCTLLTMLAKQIMVERKLIPTLSLTKTGKALWIGGHATHQCIFFLSLDCPKLLIKCFSKWRHDTSWIQCGGAKHRVHLAHVSSCRYSRPKTLNFDLPHL